MAVTKVRKSLRSFFGLGKTTKAELHDRIYDKYDYLCASGHHIDIHIGNLRCRHCNKNEMALYRSTLFQGREIDSDVLRAEQAIEQKVGKVVLTFPVTWNGEAARLRKELPRKCWDGTREESYHGKDWIVVKKEIMAKLECIKCQGLTEVWNKIVEEDGKEKLKWYLFFRTPQRTEFDGRCEKCEDKK